VAQRRADQTQPLAWEFPGGKVEPGESPSQALVREIQEELACSIEVGAVVDVVFFAYDAFDLIMPVYRATIRAGVPVARQVAAVVWVARAELASLAFTPADVPLARLLAGGVDGCGLDGTDR
jgi:8-oxo-dGTP diphosphatase